MTRPPQTDISGLQLLVVEDSELMRRRMVEQLLDLEEVAQVTEAGDVAAAVELLSYAHPDTAILDFNLPGGTALDVLREIKRRSPEMGVIVFTASSADQIRDACLEQGADFFFSKSADFFEVEEAVRELGRRPHGGGSGAEEG